MDPGGETGLRAHHFSTLTLFPNPLARHPEKRWTAWTLGQEWHRARKKAGLAAEVTLYEGTKHSSATHWLNSGAKLEDVQAMLRHRDRRSTEIYAKRARVGLVEMLRTGRKEIQSG